ncbi:hypothetical protein EX30DRAFT_341786 [Ascodesmis nigricans]|uniref:GPR1/FUN34/YaaH-class plasma membrane protein n=1 Tax=Ascodesmis nigricans TaxID=341454 RepID=A0A4S2MUM0_9PEZI|nr:hypothetical protein EX30DRAFT_341786 [Ascodesmis nigricans]
MADSITISRGAFENMISKDTYVPLSKKWANPTPLALAGLVMALTPLSCQLMGWRGSDSSGSANNGTHFFCGGILMFVAGLLEFFLGHTYSFVVFCSYGGFFAALSSAIASGASDDKFYASYGFFYLFMGLLSFVFLLGSLGTNVCFVILFIAYSIAFPLLAGADWAKAMGNYDIAHRCEVGGGAACFVVSIMAWWVLASQVLDCVDSPLKLPIGDLSSVMKKRGSVVEQDVELGKKSG